jgi:hypothetical protein
MNNNLNSDYVDIAVGDRVLASSEDRELLFGTDYEDLFGVDDPKGFQPDVEGVVTYISQDRETMRVKVGEILYNCDYFTARKCPTREGQWVTGPGEPLKDFEYRYNAGTLFGKLVYISADGATAKVKDLNGVTHDCDFKNLTVSSLESLDARDAIIAARLENGDSIGDILNEAHEDARNDDENDYDSF